MLAKLTKELSAALHATGEQRLEVIDPETNRIYMLVDGETHRRAMAALQRQQDEPEVLACRAVRDRTSQRRGHRLRCRGPPLCDPARPRSAL